MLTTAPQHKTKSTMIVVKTMHAWAVLIIAVLSPVATVAAIWYKSDKAAQDVRMRLEVERGFVNKDEFKGVAEKLDKIGTDVAEMKGELKEMRRLYSANPRSRNVLSASLYK